MSEYIRCKLIRIWCATPEKVIRTSYRVRVVCVITKDDRNTPPSHTLTCMYALSSRITRQVCIFVLDGVLFDRLERSGVAWIWLAFSSSDKRRNQTAAVIALSPPVRIMPIIDLPPLEPFPLSGHAAMTFRVISTVFPSTRLQLSRTRPRLSVPVVSPRSAGPSSPDLFLLWETTHRRTSPTVSTTRSDPVDEIWRLMAIAVCLGSFRQQTCTPQHSAFPLEGDTCHRVLVVSSLVEFT